MFLGCSPTSPFTGYNPVKLPLIPKTHWKEIQDKYRSVAEVEKYFNKLDTEDYKSGQCVFILKDNMLKNKTKIVTIIQLFHFGFQFPSNYPRISIQDVSILKQIEH